MKNLVKILASAGLVAAMSVPARSNNPASLKSFSISEESPLMMRESVRKVAEQGADAPLISAPDGDATVYTRDSFTYVVMGGMAFANPDYAGASIVVDGTDGFVYISNPYASIVTGSWLKGKRESGRIVVDLPQLIYQVEYEGEIYDYYAYMMELKSDDSENGMWYYPTESQQLVYEIENGCLMFGSGEENTVILGLCDENGGWTGHGDMSQTYSVLDVQPGEVPSDCKISDWQLTSGGTGHYIQLASGDGNVYVKGLSKDFPDVWVRGEKTADGVFFPSGQYLGVDAATCHHNYLYGADNETYWNEMYEMELTRNILADNILFLTSDKGMSASGRVLVNKGKEMYLPSTTYEDLNLLENPEKLSPYPANPQLSSLIAYSDTWGYGAIVFNLPSLNMDGYLLPTERMSYMVYVDGEPLELYSDEYPGIEDESYLIPYAYDDGSFIKSFGVGHIFYYFFDGFTTIGIQSVYEEDGELYGSQVVFYDLSLTDINKLEADCDNVVSEEYYDLQGRRLHEPTEGITIRVTRYADGRVLTKKVMSR